MSKQSRRNFLKLAGATAATLATGTAVASENPFAFKKMQVSMEGKCAAHLGQNKTLATTGFQRL